MASIQHRMYVPLDLIQTPVTGECLVDHFWMVDPEKGALYVLDEFAIGHSDCVREVANCNKAVADRFLLEGHVVMQIPIAFMSHGRRMATVFREEVRAIILARRKTA